MSLHMDSQTYLLVCTSCSSTQYYVVHVSYPCRLAYLCMVFDCSCIVYCIQPPIDRGCTGEFSGRKSKKTNFGSMYTTKIGQAGHAERDFSQYPPLPILSQFIEHHVHQNQPLWERICDNNTASSRHWQRNHCVANTARLQLPAEKKRPQSTKTKCNDDKSSAEVT
jgi:hypothetical protein